MADSDLARCARAQRVPDVRSLPPSALRELNALRRLSGTSPHVVPLLGENTRARVEGTRAGRGVLIAAAAGVGMAVQAGLYLADSNAWYLPNGSAIPAPLRLLLSAPLALENALEEVRLACKCDLGRLQGIAGVSIDASFMSVLANHTWAAPARI